MIWLRKLRVLVLSCDGSCGMVELNVEIVVVDWNIWLGMVKFLFICIIVGEIGILFCYILLVV